MYVQSVKDRYFEQEIWHGKKWYPLPPPPPPPTPPPRPPRLPTQLYEIFHIYISFLTYVYKMRMLFARWFKNYTSGCTKQENHTSECTKQEIEYFDTSKLFCMVLSCPHPAPTVQDYLQWLTYKIFVEDLDGFT